VTQTLADLGPGNGWCQVYALFREDIKEEVPSGKGEGREAKEQKEQQDFAMWIHVTYCVQ
jgi:hypothetical protein